MGEVAVVSSDWSKGSKSLPVYCSTIGIPVVSPTTTAQIHNALLIKENRNWGTNWPRPCRFYA